MGGRAKRARRRMACGITTGGQRFSGLILDLSATGLFVQTRAKPRPGEPLSVEISVPGLRAPLRVEAQVARLQVVPAHLLNVAHGGIGLRITNAPEAYFAFLAAILPEEVSAAPPERTQPAAPGAAAADASGSPGRPPGRGWRVRVTQIGGARSRTLRVTAGSAEAAAALAREEMGEGWKVLEACPDDEAAG
jgi:hypothetical protein